MPSESPQTCPSIGSLTENMIEKLKKHPKRIVFPDGEDIRVLRVAEKMVSLEIVAPILLGDRKRIHAMAAAEDISLTFVSVIDPANSETDLFCSRLEKTARYRGKEIADPKEIVCRPHNFAALMVQYGHADGMVAGNASLPATVFRAVIAMIKPTPGVPQIFGTMVLSKHSSEDSDQPQTLFMADCGVIPEPDVKQLASIAVETGKLALHFLGRRPRIAMLSHSTHGSAGTLSAKKMLAAAQLARQQIETEFLDMEIDGEVQADVALDAAAAEIKVKDTRAHSAADVLVFPNLDAGHISLKLLQHLGEVDAFGQLIMGVSKPVAQVPRTISEEALFSTAALVGIEAIKSNELHRTEGNTAG